MNVEKLDAMAKPRSKEAIAKAEERKSSRKISEDYCSYELSRLLEEKGFHAPDLHGLDSSQNHLWVKVTHQMAMKWLRDVHKLHIEICRAYDYSTDADNAIVDEWWYWTYKVISVETACLVYIADDDRFDTFYETVEESLKYSLEKLI